MQSNILSCKNNISPYPLAFTGKHFTINLVKSYLSVFSISLAKSILKLSKL